MPPSAAMFSLYRGVYRNVLLSLRSNSIALTPCAASSAPPSAPDRIFMVEVW